MESARFWEYHFLIVTWRSWHWFVFYCSILLVLGALMILFKKWDTTEAWYLVHLLRHWKKKATLVVLVVRLLSSLLKEPQCFFQAQRTPLVQNEQNQKQGEYYTLMSFSFNSSRQKNLILELLISHWEIHNGRGVIFKLGSSIFYWSVFFLLKHLYIVM